MELASPIRRQFADDVERPETRAVAAGYEVQHRVTRSADIQSRPTKTYPSAVRKPCRGLGTSTHIGRDRVEPKLVSDCEPQCARDTQSSTDTLLTRQRSPYDRPGSKFRREGPTPSPLPHTQPHNRRDETDDKGY